MQLQLRLVLVLVLLLAPALALARVPRLAPRAAACWATAARTPTCTPDSQIYQALAAAAAAVAGKGQRWAQTTASVRVQRPVLWQHPRPKLPCPSHLPLMGARARVMAALLGDCRRHRRPLRSAQPLPLPLPLCPLLAAATAAPAADAAALKQRGGRTTLANSGLQRLRATAAVLQVVLVGA